MKKNQPRLIRWTPTLLMIMMILGAGVLGWNQIEFLNRPVMIASGLFLNLCMLVGIVSTLRAVQLHYITGTVIKGSMSIGLFVMLWIMGTVVTDQVGQMLYRFVLLGTFGMGVYLITTLAGKGSVVDDGYFDEDYTKMKGSQKQQTYSSRHRSNNNNNNRRHQKKYKPQDFELEINN